MLMPGLRTLLGHGCGRLLMHWLQDAEVVHTEDRVDPVADLEIIHHELRQKDIERMEKVVEGLAKVRSSCT